MGISWRRGCLGRRIEYSWNPGVSSAGVIASAGALASADILTSVDDLTVRASSSCQQDSLGKPQKSSSLDDRAIKALPPSPPPLDFHGR